MKRIIVIMAGGTGTRLWPLSRKQRPKQFHTLLSPETLLQETYKRARRIVPEENIFISTTKQYTDLVFENLPTLSNEQCIIEPSPRSTAPSIALASLILSKKFPQSIIATIASDHAILNVEEFTQALTTTFEVAEKYPESIVTTGINPTHPSTAFGYIQIGKELEDTFTKRAFFANSFKEKPDEKTAKKYLAGWEYLWNAGYFTFQTDFLLKAIEKLAPQIHKQLIMIGEEFERKNPSPKNIEKFYAKMPEEPIDTIIIEKLSQSQRIVIPTDLEWDDIGNWESLYTFLAKQHNTSLISQGNHIDLGSSQSLVFAKEKLISTLDLKDIVIIDSHDTVLIANRKTVGSRIKDLLKKFKDEGKHPYL
jgi:mannose-1-phosphate guanylyltransferase